MLVIQEAWEKDNKEANGFEEAVENALRTELSKSEYNGLTDAEKAEKLMAPQVVTATREDYVAVDPEDPETLYEKITTEYVVETKIPRWCEITIGLAYASNSVTAEDITNLN